MKILNGLKEIFKKYMLAGTAVLVPLIGTYLILKFIINSFDSMMISLLPSNLRPQNIFGVDIPGFGLVATIVLILIVGVFTRLYIGRYMVVIGDRIIAKIPLGRSIYSGIKKFMATILANHEERFKSVVAVEYPRRGCWVIGFVTSDACKETKKLAPEDMVNVFVPTTPNPTSGFMIIIPKSDVRNIDLNIDEAFKLLISGGIINQPENHI